jgi:hypothetical protein
MHHWLTHQAMRQPLLGALQWFLNVSRILERGQNLLHAAIARKDTTARLAQADMGIHCLSQCGVCLIKGDGNQGVFLEAAWK